MFNGYFERPVLRDQSFRIPFIIFGIVCFVLAFRLFRQSWPLSSFVEAFQIASFRVGLTFVGCSINFLILVLSDFLQERSLQAAVALRIASVILIGICFLLSISVLFM